MSLYIWDSLLEQLLDTACNGLNLLGLIGDLGGEVGSLVLIDPLGDPFGLGLASIGESLGVSNVWKTKVCVMGRVHNVESDSLVIDLLGHTTCLPWVKFTV